MIVLMNKLRTQMRWIMLIIVLAFLLSTFLMYDSGSRSGGSSSERREDYAVAEINGRQLMRSALEQRALMYLEQYGSASTASVDMPYIYQSVLNQYVMELQLAQEVRDSGIIISDAEAEQAMKRYADSAFPTREAFYQYLDRSGVKVADYKASLAQQMASERLMRVSIGEIAVSDDEAAAFYDNMKDFFFRRPAGFMVNLVSFVSRDDAENVRGLLLEGKTWSEATSSDVVDSSKIVRVTPEPTFMSETAFEGAFAPMKSDDIGVVSSVFEIVSDDFAVAVKTEAVEEKVSSYDEVSEDVRAIIQQQKEREALNTFTRGLLERARVALLDASLFPSAGSGAGVLPVSAPDADLEGAAPEGAAPEGEVPEDSAPASTDAPTGQKP
jgi:hypothetical protein